MRVFISGPLENGNQRENVRKAMAAGVAIQRAGHAPLIPHLDWFLDIAFPSEYEAYMRTDFAWLAVSDAMVRLPGYSPGSEREESEAKRIGIPVFHSVEEFLEHAGGKKAEILKFSC